MLSHGVMFSHLLQAVSVLESTLVAMGNKELELQKALVDCVVRLLLAGNVKPCLGLAERWARNADQSVTRHLVRRLLVTCAPPYSPAFATALFKCATPLQLCVLPCTCTYCRIAVP
jgi:hypothetical protein